MTRDEAWVKLKAAANAFAMEPNDAKVGQSLSQAAKDWASVNGYVLVVGGVAPASTGAVFPNYGNAKGQAVRGAAVKDLKFYRGGCERTLADESKSRWHEKERALMAAIDDELARQGASEEPAF